MGGIPKLNFNVKPVHIFKYIDGKCTVLDIGYVTTEIMSDWVNDENNQNYHPHVFYNGFIVKFMDYPEWKMIIRGTHLWEDDSYGYRFSFVMSSFYNRAIARFNNNMADFVDMVSDRRLPINADERFDYIKESLKEASSIHLSARHLFHLEELTSFPRMVKVDGDLMTINFGTCFTTKPNDTLEVNDD